MNCSEFLAQLGDFLDNQVTTGLVAELQTHLEGCEHCVITMRTTRKTIEIYRNHEVYELPVELRERLQTAILAKCKRAAEASAGSTAAGAEGEGAYGLRKYCFLFIEPTALPPLPTNPTPWTGAPCSRLPRTWVEHDRAKPVLLSFPSKKQEYKSHRKA